MTVTGKNKAVEIHGILQEYHESKLFNGSAEVSFNGEVLINKGFGYTDLSRETPVTGDTRFFVGSNTKQFTSSIIFRLASKGLLELDGKLSAYLPYFRKDLGRRITIYHLLTHSSGIPNYTAVPGFDPATSFQGLPEREVICKISSPELEFEPGSMFKYSNTNYYILGGVIEQLTGKAYRQVLEENITTPLELRNTGFYKGDEDAGLFAKSYYNMGTGFEEMPLPRPNVFFSSGSIYSSSSDMAKWINHLISGDVIPEEYRNIALIPVFSNYACGIASVEAGASELHVLLEAPLQFVSKSIWKGERTYRFYLHRGAVEGFNSFWITSPELGMTIVLLNSFRNYVFLEEIIYRIMKVLL